MRSDSKPTADAVLPVIEKNEPDLSLFQRGLRYFLPLAFLFFAGAAVYFYSRYHDDVTMLTEQSSRVVKESRQLSSRVLQRVMSDAMTLAEDQSFIMAIETKKDSRRTELLAEWIAVQRIKRIFDQIRYLDAEGYEHFRVNYNDGAPALVTEQNLQNKSDRPYYRVTKNLSKGEFYLSPLDLNVENSEVEMPYKPVIRIALPVFDREGNRLGVFVVNYLASDLIYRMSSSQESSELELMLLNEQGQWLFGGKVEDNWAFMFGRNTNLDTRFPNVWLSLLDREGGQFSDNTGVWTWETVYPLLEAGMVSTGSNPLFEAAQTPKQLSGHFWKIVVRVPAEQLLARQQTRVTEFFMSLAMGWFLLALASARFALVSNKQELAEQKIRQLNQTLEAQVQERTRRLQNEIFDRQMAERRYRESSEQYQHMVSTTVDGYWLLDDRAGFLDANKAACDMLGVTHDALLSMTIADFEADEYRGDLEGQLAGLMLVGSKRFDTRLRRPDGEVIDVEISASYLPDYMRFISFVRDISERKRVERERQLAAMVMSNADEAIFVVSAEGYVLSANAAFARVTGIATEKALGMQVDHLGISAVNAAKPLSQLLDEGSVWRSEMRGRRVSGEVYSVWFSASEVKESNGQVSSYVCVFSDISEIKESQARLDFLAHHDALTGLPNRLLFRARLEHSVERAGRSKNQIAVMFIDLDRFKEVNDTLGHAVGDQLLIDLSAAMAECLRAEDTLARLGGDEFVVLLEQVTGRESVDAVLEKMSQLFPWTLSAKEGSIEVTASIGVALFPQTATDADDLVHQADAAMYRAKDAGRNQAIYA